MTDVHTCIKTDLTSLKLQLRPLSELALSEGVAVLGCSALQHSGPVDGSKHRHQHPEQGTYNITASISCAPITAQ